MFELEIILILNIQPVRQVIALIRVIILFMRNLVLLQELFPNISSLMQQMVKEFFWVCLVSNLYEGHPGQLELLGYLYYEYILLL